MMTWHPQRDGSHLATPYKIVKCVKGYSLWRLTPQSIKRIGDDIKTLGNAKALAELHAKGDRHVVSA